MLKKFKIGEYLAKLQARMWLSHALLEDEESARGSHLLARYFAKYSPI